MLTALAIAPAYNYQLILIPAIIIFLSITSLVALRFSSLWRVAGFLLMLIGSSSLALSVFLTAFWGEVTGFFVLAFGSFWYSLTLVKKENKRTTNFATILLVTMIALLFLAPIIGNIIGFFVGLSGICLGLFGGGLLAATQVKNTTSALIEKLRKQPRVSHLKKSVYGIFTILIIVCSLLVAARATKVIREEWNETFSYSDSSNLTLKGTVTSVKYNYEVNTGYSYHIFTAYITLKVTQIIGGWYANVTGAYEELSAKDLVVLYEKTPVPPFTVGQSLEITGYYCLWIEDSMYSEKLIVSSTINGSYLNPL
jgi:hypothetical protein